MNAKTILKNIAILISPIHLIVVLPYPNSYAKSAIFV